MGVSGSERPPPLFDPPRASEIKSVVFSPELGGMKPQEFPGDPPVLISPAPVAPFPAERGSHRRTSQNLWRFDDASRRPCFIAPEKVMAYF